ncbi:MAG: hypothetical protein LBU85_12900 [Treponema sp.]|jgi:hypothetical protein|nr:hypothetical protein [Treponema sp.]
MKDMQKLLIAASIAFVLTVFGCDAESYTVTITNKTGNTVTYIYNDLLESLDKDKSQTYTIKAYTQPPTITGNDADKIIILYNSLTGDYTFTSKEE